MRPPFVSYVRLRPDANLVTDRFPGSLPFLPDLDLEFTTQVTFFVGENGSGKSTLLEAMAELAGLPRLGGSMNEVEVSHGLREVNPLGTLLRMAFSRQPRDGYFFRAELQAHFASLLDQRRLDPAFAGDPYQYYGGKSLVHQSHGEAFLSVMQNRFQAGLFLLDEPESALSPQRQLTLLALMYDLAGSGNAQFIVATHSPILLTFPDARIISFDAPDLPTVTLADTAHFRITQGILNRPESYWKHLRTVEDSD